MKSGSEATAGAYLDAGMMASGLQTAGLLIKRERGPPLVRLPKSRTK